MRAIACGTALPMNRANLRCLGLSVGITIALAGCDINRDSNASFEQEEAVYANTASAGLRGAISRVAVSDGRLSFAEWQAIQAELEASGMSAGTAETQSGSGRQPASPARDSGDAQKEAP